jgi:hypothetical protein
MPILNYTTKISVLKTVSEIQEILAKAGALAVQIDYDAGMPTALVFSVDVEGQRVGFRLPSRHYGVLKTLEKQKVERRYRTDEQARRVAWRITKDWVLAQLALIEAGQAELAEVFLPYAVDPKTGGTLYETMRDARFQLGAGDDVVEGEWNERA